MHHGGCWRSGSTTGPPEKATRCCTLTWLSPTGSRGWTAAGQRWTAETCTGIDHRTPLIRFVQKGKGVVSFTGEKLYEVQVIAAVDQALAALRGRYHFLAAVAELVDGTTPRLVYLIEFDDPVTDQDGSAMVDRLDAALGEENDEYLTKRKSPRYGAPVIRVVRPGEFDRYRRRMVETGQRADGQFKVLRLTSDVSFAAEFTAERDLIGSERTKT
jgi:hypothetical protein